MADEDMGSSDGEWVEPTFNDDVLGRVLSFVDPDIIGKSARVNQQWHDVAEQDHIWRDLVLRRWTFASDKENQSWKNYFRTKHTRQKGWARGRPMDFRMYPRRGHTNFITDVSLQPNYAISTSSDGTARVWSLKGDASDALHVLEHGAHVNCVSVFDSSRFAATGTKTGVLSIWDIERAECVGHWNGTTNNESHIKAVAVDDEADLAVVENQSGQVFVWDIRTRNAPTAGQRHSLTPVAVVGGIVPAAPGAPAGAPAAPAVPVPVPAPPPGLIMPMPFPPLPMPVPIPPHPFQPTFVEDSMRGYGVWCQFDKRRQIVSSTPDKVSVWDIRAPGAAGAAGTGEVHAFSPNGQIEAVVWSSATDEVAFGGPAGELQIWDTKRGTQKDSIMIGGGVTAVTINQNGVAVGSQSGAVALNRTVGSTANANRWKHVEGTGSARVNDIAFDGNKIITAGADNAMLVFDGQGTKLYALLGGSMTQRASNPNPMHPERPWVSAVRFDDREVLCVVNSMLRLYNFDPVGLGA